MTPDRFNALLAPFDATWTADPDTGRVTIKVASWTIARDIPDRITATDNWTIITATDREWHVTFAQEAMANHHIPASVITLVNFLLRLPPELLVSHE